VIDTDRLHLTPLTPDEAHAIMEGRESPDYAPGYPAEGTLVAAAIVATAGEELGPWTMYQARTREEGRVVAGLGFIAPPDEAGEARIGFSETEEARAEGYTAEAVGALVSLAKREGARLVVAETADPRAAEVFLEAGLEQVSVCGGLRHFQA
jgi:ribosomal-protein-alanine N-acetyltransferase